MVKHPSVINPFATKDRVPGARRRSFRQFYDRCSDHWKISRVDKEKNRVVTHGGFLGAIFRYVLSIPLDADRNFVLLNCSVNRLEKTDTGWNLVSWGDVAHLDGLDSLDDA